MKKYSSLLLSLLFILPLCAEQVNTDALNGWAISVELFNYIRKTIPEGSTILELGSGTGTGELVKFYTVFSIEHDVRFLDLHHSNYIFAPIKNYHKYRWYDNTILAAKLPKKYDAILIDGPPGGYGREGFFKNIHLFDIDVLLIFDDVNRKPERKLFYDVVKHLKRPYQIIECSDKKWFGIIRPKETSEKES